MSPSIDQQQRAAAEVVRRAALALADAMNAATRLGLKVEEPEFTSIFLSTNDCGPVVRRELPLIMTVWVEVSVPLLEWDGCFTQENPNGTDPLG